MQHAAAIAIISTRARTRLPVPVGHTVNIAIPAAPKLRGVPQVSTAIGRTRTATRPNTTSCSTYPAHRYDCSPTSILYYDGTYYRRFSRRTQFTWLIKLSMLFKSIATYRYIHLVLRE